MTSICEICNKDYKYPSKLKIHYNSVYGCKYRTTPVLVIANESTDILPVNINITNENEIINLSNNNNFICDKCNKSFKCKFSLTRHTNNVRCLSRTINNNIQNTTNHGDVTNVDVTNGDVNNGTINDNRQINITNNIIIQHINPFGHENTDFLSNSEKLAILRSGHTACIKILKIVYNRNENKNFYKVNKKNASISYLKDTITNNSASNTPNNSFNNIINNISSNTSNSSASASSNSNTLIDVFQHKEFRKEIFNNSTTLLYSIMLDCKNELCFEEQLSLMDNITSIKNDVYNEIFTNSLSNLRKELGEPLLDTETKNEIHWGIENVIAYETENNNDNNRKKINNYVKQINEEPIVKEIFTANVSKEKRKRNKIKNELNDKTLIEDIDNRYGKIEYGELANQLQIAHYPDTKFAKKLADRTKIEENLVKDNNTLGKLNSYNEIKRNRTHNIKQILNYENNISKLKELSNNDDLYLDVEIDN